MMPTLLRRLLGLLLLALLLFLLFPNAFQQPF